MTPHLSQDDLLAELYGIGGHERHLRECAPCAARLEGMVRTKAQVRTNAEAHAQVSSGFLAAQRRSIYARLDAAAAAATSSYVRWAPALAGAALLAIGLLLLPHAPVMTTQAPQAVAQTDMTSDEKLVSDLYSMEQSLEPSVDAPIHELFEDGPEAGDQ